MSANAAQTQDQDTAKTEKSGGGGDDHMVHDVRHSHVSSYVSKYVTSHVTPHPHEVGLSVLANRLLHGSYWFLVLDLLFTTRWGWQTCMLCLLFAQGSTIHIHAGTLLLDN